LWAKDAELERPRCRQRLQEAMCSRSPPPRTPLLAGCAACALRGGCGSLNRAMRDKTFGSSIFHTDPLRTTAAARHLAQVAASTSAGDSRTLLVPCGTLPHSLFTSLQAWVRELSLGRGGCEPLFRLEWLRLVVSKPPRRVVGRRRVPLVSPSVGAAV
jgi:hypothetical protein